MTISGIIKRAIKYPTVTTYNRDTMSIEFVVNGYDIVSSGKVLAETFGLSFLAWNITGNPVRIPEIIQKGIHAEIIEYGSGYKLIRAKAATDKECIDMINKDLLANPLINPVLRL